MDLIQIKQWDQSYKITNYQRKVKRLSLSHTQKLLSNQTIKKIVYTKM